MTTSIGKTGSSQVLTTQNEHLLKQLNGLTHEISLCAHSLKDKIQKLTEENDAFKKANVDLSGWNTFHKKSISIDSEKEIQRNTHNTKCRSQFKAGIGTQVTGVFVFFFVSPPLGSTMVLGGTGLGLSKPRYKCRESHEMHIDLLVEKFKDKDPTCKKAWNEIILGRENRNSDFRKEIKKFLNQCYSVGLKPDDAFLYLENILKNSPGIHLYKALSCTVEIGKYRKQLCEEFLELKNDKASRLNYFSFHKEYVKRVEKLMSIDQIKEKIQKFYEKISDDEVRGIMTFAQNFAKESPLPLF